ncbi:MAG: flavin-containing monooxygenase [Bacteroidales bacterium]
MIKRQFDTVIIGGGQAGLATGYHLKRLGQPFVILDEKDKVGDAWRNRWESLRLFTPARYSSLPGMPFPGPAYTYPGKDDVADYLGDYVNRFGLPVRNGIKVVQVRTEGNHYMIETNDGLIFAHNVVVATGAFHHPRIPDFAGSLDPQITQIHSSEYKKASQIGKGPVLVVGAGQSGAEIALDLARDHQVWLSGRDPGEEGVVRGTLSGRLITPVIVFAATKVINVANPVGKKLRRHFLYPPRGIPRAGGTRKLIKSTDIECVGRTTGTSDGYPQTEEGKVRKVKTVVWCTGFVADYSWIDLLHCDEYGYPEHRRGIVDSHPGLYFVGLPFQSTISSSLIFGVGRDARYIAGHIAAHSIPEGIRYKLNAKSRVAESVT